MNKLLYIIKGLCKNYKDFKWRHYDDSQVSKPIDDLQNYLLKTNAFPYILFYKKINQKQINTSKFKNKQKVQSHLYLSIKSQVTKSISSISIDDTNAYESGKHNKYTLNIILLIVTIPKKCKILFTKWLHKTMPAFHLTIP